MDRVGIRRVAAEALWLVVGCALLLFMGGTWNVLVAAWTGSVFFLKYFRTRRSALGVALALSPILAASYVFFLGLAVQVTVGFQILIAVSYTLYVVVPCVADRILYRRLPGRLLPTLVCPAAAVVVQLLLSLLEPLGTTLTSTHFLFGMKPFIQLLALPGVWGPSFLPGWFASVASAAWEQQFDLRAVALPVGLFAGVLGAVTGRVACSGSSITT